MQKQRQPRDDFPVDIKGMKSPIEKLEQDLEVMGYMVAQAVGRQKKEGNPLTILFTGPPAAKKSTFTGIFRHLIESSGFTLDKVKDGMLTEVGEDLNKVEYDLGRRSQVALWETTVVLPPAESVGLHIELQGSVSARVSRLAEKTGSYEFAQIAVSGHEQPKRYEWKKPDLTVDTDAITIAYEQGGRLTESIRKGWVRGLGEHGIALETPEMHNIYEYKRQVLRKIGFDGFLSESQMEFVAMRLRQDAIRSSVDGRAEVLASRVNHILGETVTGKIPLKPAQVAEQNRYVIESGAGLDLSQLQRPNCWITTNTSEKAGKDILQGVF